MVFNMSSERLFPRFKKNPGNIFSMDDLARETTILGK